MNELGNTPADKNYKPSGISRAEEAALKRFPEEMTRIPYQDLIEAFGGKEYVDFNSMPRGYFQLGYEQAEKDTINRVCDWLEKNAVNYNGSESAFDHKEVEMIEELRKHFKEERK